MFVYSFGRKTSCLCFHHRVIDLHKPQRRTTPTPSVRGGQLVEIFVVIYKENCQVFVPVQSIIVWLRVCSFIKTLVKCRLCRCYKSCTQERKSAFVFSLILKHFWEPLTGWLCTLVISVPILINGDYIKPISYNSSTALDIQGVK